MVSLALYQLVKHSPSPTMLGEGLAEGFDKRHLKAPRLRLVAGFKINHYEFLNKSRALAT